MKISNIDFPKPLFDALRVGRLVVFAGAGVSMGEPAVLPGFRALAEAIAHGTGEMLVANDPEDRFLGNLQDKGVEVHAIAAQQLQKPDLRPTSLHKDLLRLYSVRQSVRLVTTNFDALFEQAADDVFDSQPGIFHAPALPLGTNFKGIVHVHGSVDSPGEMVLTDKDFGRAYLIEGWARRFLVNLFRTYTVLFVGYSHSDVVMNYLARALPPTEIEPRFALTEDADIERWRALSIEPIVYPRSPNDNHVALSEGVTGLAKLVTRGTLDWQRMITQIAQNPPSRNREEMDLIDEAISDRERLRFFTAAASHTEWLYWLEVRGHLDGLFQSDELDDPQRMLALWLVETFSSQASDRLFSLIGRHGMRLNYTFWTMLAREAGPKNRGPSSTGTFAQWVSLLVQTLPETPSPEAVTDFLYLLMLSEECIQRGLTEALVSIFRKLTEIRLTPSGMTAPFEPKPLGQHYALERIWERCLSPNLDTLAQPVLEVAVESLDTQYNEYKIWQNQEHRFDPMSAHRWAIEPCEYDRFPRSHDVLIDAARDCLEHLSAHKPDEMVDWRDKLATFDAPILRRLAVHVLFQCDDMSAGQKIAWLLHRTWIHEISENHEIARVVESAYQQAGDELRSSFVNSVIAHRFEGNGQEQDDYLTANYQYDWFHLLESVAPECIYAKSAFKDLLDRHPGLRREVPPKPLTKWETLDSGSPWPVSELRESLLSSLASDPSWPDGTNLLSRIEDAASKNFLWSIDLADSLSTDGLWDTSIWERLLRAWAHGLNPDTRMQVLDKLKSPDLQQKHARAVAEVLYSFVNASDQTSVPVYILEVAGKVARPLWQHLGCVKSGLEEGDALEVAINHPAGSLAQFWCNSHSLWREKNESNSSSFEANYYEALSEIVQDITLAGRHGRSVLARNLAHLLVIDDDWARDNLLPMFEEDGNTADFQAVWHGFMYGGPLNPAVAELIQGAFFKAVAKMESTFPELRVRILFISRLTAMLTYFVDDPIAVWLPEFFKQADSDDRRSFARSIGSILRSMSAEQQQELWERWLNRYWQNRLLGIPEPLEPDEVDAMHAWLPVLGELFSEAVEYAIQMPPTISEHNLILHEINSTRLWSKNPEATAQLLIHLTKSKLLPWALHDAKDLIEALLDPDIGVTDDLRVHLEELRASL